MNIIITGATGFVGSSLIETFKDQYNFIDFDKRLGTKFNLKNIGHSAFIHLAGKAHDLKNTCSANEYYQVNTELTKTIFNDFLESDANVFISISSVKAVADIVDGILSENFIPNPTTHYGKSKLFAEQYILNKDIPIGKRVYILRPCMIHGPGNKGNLNLLFKFVNKGIPWPLGAYENKRSFCSIDNLSFIIKELIENEKIISGVYNVADDEPISTNDLIRLIANSQNKKPRIINFPKSLINKFAQFGDLSKFPLNTERLNKLTESYIVSNTKIKHAINKSLPVSSRDGLIKTLTSFGIND